MPNRAAVSNACAFAGLALYCAMLRPPFFGSLATSSTPDPSGMRISFDCATILIGIVLIVLPALKRFDDKATASRVLDAVSLAAPAGVLLVCAGRFFDVAAPAFFNASVIVLSIGFAALTMNWFREATAISRRHIAAFALGAFVASHLCGAVDLLPRDAAAVLSVLYPLASLALLRAHRRSRPISKPENIDDEQSDAPGALPALPHQQRFFRRLRLLALLLIFIEVLCGAFLRSIYSSGGINYTTASHTGYTYLVSAAIGIVLLLIALRARTATEGTLAVGGTGLVGFAMIVVLLLVLPMSDLVPFITGLYSALLVYLMALIELWRSDADRTSAACAGTFIALYATVSSITASIIPALFSYYGHAPDELLAPIGAMAGLIVALGVGVALFAMVFIQREMFLEAVQLARSGRQQPLDEAVAAQPPASAPAAQDANAQQPDRAQQPLLPQPPDAPAPAPATPAPATPAIANAEDAHRRVASALADAYGLTEREQQTAALVAKGYTAKRVAEELGVAPSTVQGYSKSIYRKMGIHRKDELIEAVNQLEQSL